MSTSMDTKLFIFLFFAIIIAGCSSENVMDKIVNSLEDVNSFKFESVSFSKDKRYFITGELNYTTGSAHIKIQYDNTIVEQWFFPNETYFKVNNSTIERADIFWIPKDKVLRILGTENPIFVERNGGRIIYTDGRNNFHIVWTGEDLLPLKRVSIIDNETVEIVNFYYQNVNVTLSDDL